MSIQDQLTANQAALDSLIAATNANLAAASNAAQIGGVDVANLDTISDGAIFIYRSIADRFEAVKAIGDLAGAADGEILRWSSASGRFELASPSEVSLALSELTDVAAEGITDGQVLKWNAATSQFEPGALVAASAGEYVGIGKIQIVDGAEITISAGITTIQSDAPLLPELTTYDAAVDARISVSSTWNSTYPKWKALTLATGVYDYWNSADALGQFWEYTFPAPVSMGRVSLMIRNLQDGTSFKDFKIQTTTGGVLTDRVAVVNAPVWGISEVRSFAFPSVTASVEKLRISTTATYMGTTYNTISSSIVRIQAYSQIAPSSGLGSIAGGFAKARKAILAGIAISGNNAFIPCGFAEGTDKIFRVDTATKSINGDFSLGATQIYSVDTVSSSAGGSFSFSVQKNQQAAPIVAAPGNKAYIAIGSEIRVYSSTNGNLIATIDCGVATEIQGLGISVEQGKVYGASKAGAIVVIDTGTDTLSKTLTATDDAAYGGENFAVAVDDTRDAVYITSRSTNKVLVLNTITDTLVTSINVGSTPEGIGLSTTLGKAVVCNRVANTVSIINTTNNTVGGSVAMSAVGSGSEPTDAAIDEVTGRAVVCLYNYHQVAIINLATNTVEGRAATSPNPQQAVFVPATNEIYVASEGGDITVIAQA
jgi:YVTN family beta-propeller protein